MRRSAVSNSRWPCLDYTKRYRQWAGECPSRPLRHVQPITFINQSHSFIESVGCSAMCLEDGSNKDIYNIISQYSFDDYDWIIKVNRLVSILDRACSSVLHQRPHTTLTRASVLSAQLSCLTASLPHCSLPRCLLMNWDWVLSAVLLCLFSQCVLYLRQKCNLLCQTQSFLVFV